MIHLFVVDDHRMVVDGIQSFLEKSKELKVIGSAQSFDEALRKIVNNDLSFDLLLTDYHLGEKTGIDLYDELKKRKIQFKTIVFTMYSNKKLAGMLAAKGIEGYVEKNSSQQTLIKAIHSVMNGSTFYPEEFSLNSNNNINNRTDAFSLEFGLSNREKEIALLVIEGKSTDKIAKELNLSPATVSTHRRNLNNKTKAYTPLDLYKLYQKFS